MAIQIELAGSVVPFLGTKKKKAMGPGPLNSPDISGQQGGH